MSKKRLSTSVINAITQLIKEKMDSDELKTKFPNKLIRSDVLDVLDMYCTVIYYPLENESNNGFHVTGIPDKTGKEHHFVYINTKQTKEKQIFTAAHELGHVWNVDNYILDKYEEQLDGVSREDIINRFAAELLIPADEFVLVFNNEFENMLANNSQASIGNFLKIIVTLMCHFCVPQRAIVYRLYELELINEQSLNLLLGENIISEEIITNYVNNLLRENGQIDFLIPTEKKYIGGFAELLDQAESVGLLSTSKIERMRETFELPKKQSDSEFFEKPVDVGSGKE